MQDEFVQLIESGLTPYEALQCATSNPPRFVGIGAGTIEPGKIADLVLLEANPLNDAANAFRQAGVMLHGRWSTNDALQRQLHSLALADDALPP
jgi:imidazolonepropionase-like amidohydrolase